MEQDAGIISTLDIQSPPLKPPLITTPGCLNTQIKEIALSGIVQNFDMPNILVTKLCEYNGVRIFAIRSSATPYFVSFATPFLCLLPRHI